MNHTLLAIFINVGVVLSHTLPYAHGDLLPGRQTYRLRRQDPWNGGPFQGVSPLVDTHAGRALIATTTVLAVFVAFVCIIGPILLSSPPSSRRFVYIGRLPTRACRQTAVFLEAGTRCTLRSAGQGTVHVFKQPLESGPHESPNYSVIDSKKEHVDKFASSQALIKYASSTEPSTSYHRQTPAAGSTSLECRGSSVTQGLSSSTSSDARSATIQHHPTPLIQGYLTNEPGSTPTFSIEPRVSNPIQVDALRHHSISTDVPIAKSLFPPSLDAIEPDRDVVTISSSTRSSRVPQGVHVDSGWPTVARHFIFCIIFVIAVSVDSLRDPEIDLHFIQEAFSSTTVLIESLFNEEATHESIERKFGLLYAEACKSATPSQIFVYFTGMGDKSGDMCLFGGITVGPQDLRLWLGKLRPKSTGTRPTIGVLFDVCRRAAGPSDTDFDHDLALVRTCMPYQWAYALYFGPGLPSSRFLTSLFLAAHDVIAGCGSFEDALKSRMAQQGRLLRFIHIRRHHGKKCQHCPENDKCQPPEIQECEWGETGRDTLLNLGELVVSAFPAVARQVEERVTAKMKACKFLEWDLSANITTAESGSRFEPHCQDVRMILSANRARERAGVTLQTTASSVVV